MSYHVQRRPRVAYQLVTNVYHEGEAVGGIETHMVTLAAASIQAGFEICAILPDSRLFDPVAQDLEAVGVEVQRFFPIKTRPLSRLPGVVNQLRDLLSRLEVDLVHVHRSVPTQGKWGIVAARAAGVAAVIATDHGLPARLGPSTRRFNQMTDRMLDAVIVVSDYCRDLELRLLNRSPVLVETVHNGIDTDYFAFADAEQRAVARAAFNLPPDVPVIGSLSRLEPVKGIGDLLYAAAWLMDKWPNLHVLIAGDGTQRRLLEARAAMLGIEGHVHFLGKYSNAPQLLAALDVFVLPTRLDTFGLVAAEAMAVGTPVVVSQIQVLPEVVADGETGVLALPQDVAAFAAATDRLLRDSELRHRMGLAGRRRVETYFSSTTMAGRTAALYHRVLAASSWQRHSFAAGRRADRRGDA